MRLLALLCVLLLAPFLDAAGVRPGMTREEVEVVIGKPTSILERGNRLVLSYPKGGRVELVNGRVVDMVAVPASAEGSGDKPATTAAAVEGKKADSPEATPSSDAAEKSKRAADAAQDAPEEWDAGKPNDKPNASLDNLLLRMVLGAVVRLVLVMIVLKLAFKWADIHGDWGQMFLPALSDTIVRSIFQIVGLYVLNIMDWFYVDEGVAYFALLFVLMKTTHACTLTRAVAVAGAAKLMSVVVGSLVMVFVLRAFT